MRGDRVDKERLIHRLECMLFVAGDPIPLSELARVLNVPPAQVHELLSDMEAEGREAGLSLIHI